VRAIASAYPRATVAVFASLPSSRSSTDAGRPARRSTENRSGITSATRTLARSISSSISPALAGVYFTVK
jgi:hypothetical protein